ncbi:MAG TPA: chromate efflux transporter [Phycisphaerales bacterium]|nr:chromate efflux transporter [Phycisphaerales bacterium]
MVSWREALRVWTMVGLQSFGGPAGQIAVMHRILVDEKRWISERRFLHALNYCMLLPGPEAMQLATYVGWLMHRTAGGLLAGTLFVLPGFLSILVLSLAYAAFQDSWAMETLFFGVKAGVLAIVVQAVLRIGRRVLRNWVMVAIAAGAFVGIHLLRLPFPVIVVGAGVVGLVGGRFAPGSFSVVGGHGANDDAESGLLDTALGDSSLDHTRPSPARAIRTAIVWGAIWLAPVGALAAWLGRASVYTQEAVFFSKAAVVTFGGAYSVLAYVAQQAVERFGWLAPGEMLDGLGMAETTPGPLIQVVQFVGFMGAFRESGGLHPLVAGSLASVLVTWVTFVPCFLWIFLGAPYVEALRGRETLTAGLSAITAAIVGVILNLAVWFGLHTLFHETFTVAWGPGRVLLPRPGSVDWASLVVVGAAFALVFGAKWGTLRVLACAVALGFGLRAVL